MPWVESPARREWKPYRELEPGEPFIDFYLGAPILPEYCTEGVETRSLRNGEWIHIPPKMWNTYAREKQKRMDYASQAGAYNATQMELFDDDV